MYEKEVLNSGYVINKEGIVFNKKGNKVKGHNRNGYMAIGFKLGKRKVNVKIHRLQAYAKYGEKIFEKGIVVRHLNNNKLDNSWDNIEIGTCHDNMMDNPQEFRMKYALNASKSSNKYSKEFVEKIREEHNNNLSYKQIMEKYDIPKSTISFIINHKYKVHIN